MIKLMLLFPPWHLGILQITGTNYFYTLLFSSGVRHKGDYSVLKDFFFLSAILSGFRLYF